MKYGHRGLSLDPSARSDLFWLHDIQRGAEEIVLYGHPDIRAVPDQVAQELRAARVRLYGPAPAAPLASRLVVLGRILRAAALAGALPTGMRGEVLRGTIAFGIELARWRNFYQSLDVRVTLTSQANGSVAETLALESLGGVAACYQLSTANIAFPSAWLTAGETVQFVSSKLFEDILAGLGARPCRFVRTGLVHHRITSRGPLGERLRRELLEAGATFVICYFDENSSDRWDSIAPDREASAEYATLARWVLADPKLGVVAKPKKASDLGRRVATAMPLLREAERTGRWRFLTDPTTYPAQAARAADVCIGRIGSTALLEASLAGVRGVEVDTQRLREHPFYRVAFGTSLFDDWDALASAIAAYRADPAAMWRFGDRTALLDALDPFRDGQAARRVGTLMIALERALAGGLDARAAVEQAEDALRLAGLTAVSG